LLTYLRYVTSQKSQDLIYTAAEAWSDANWENVILRTDKFEEDQKEKIKKRITSK
jgi:hypothetical protein